MIYYSKTTKGFYCEEIHGTNIPSDCVQITKEQHITLLNEQSNGKQIVPDENGFPIAVVPSIIPLTWEQIKSKRNDLLKDSDWSAFPDATPQPSKVAWLTYRQSLRDITKDFKDPEKVIWPDIPK